MINSNYPVSRFHSFGYTGFSHNYPTNYEKFTLKVAENVVSNAVVSTEAEDIIAMLEAGNKDAINILEQMGLNYSLTEYKDGYKIVFEQDGNKYTTAYKGEKDVAKSGSNSLKDVKPETIEEEQIIEDEIAVVNETKDLNYVTSVSDLYTDIERIELENIFKEFNNDIISLSQDIESYKNEPNADNEAYDALNATLSQILDRYDSIYNEQKDLLGQKESIQTQINTLSFPNPPSKEDYLVTKILLDGSKETVIDEERYAKALEEYENDMAICNAKNQGLTAKMEGIISELNINNLWLANLDAEKLDIIKDSNAVQKLQAMINNSKNVSKEQNLLETQKKLSELILENSEYRAKKLQAEKDFESINISDYTRDEYNSKIKEYNKHISQIQREMEYNDVDMQGILFNADLYALQSELETNGTGSKMMDRIIESNTNEYNQILEAKKNEINKLYYNRNNSLELEVPQIHMQAENETEEEYALAMNIYKYQKFLYEKMQQEVELGNRLSEHKIKKMDEKLKEIRKLLFGSTVV